MNKIHTSQTSSRPGTQTPGGAGCDIKHNSYDRYLNRLKGTKALKNSRIPEAFLFPSIPFNAAYPVYGSKLVKTAIVQSGGGCIECTSLPNVSINYHIYNNININNNLEAETEVNRNRNRESNQKEQIIFVEDTVNFPTSSASNFTKHKKIKTQQCFHENASEPFINI